MIIVRHATLRRTDTIVVRPTVQNGTAVLVLKIELADTREKARGYLEKPLELRGLA
jgi:hypothetical protein